jgi:hypothetical protein
VYTTIGAFSCEEQTVEPILKSEMSLASLEQTSEFQKLTAPQKLYVQTLLAGIRDLGIEDHVFATQTAFGNEYARVMSYAVRKSVRIQSVLRLYSEYGKSKHEILLDRVQKALEGAKQGSASRAKLIALYDTLVFEGKIPTKKSKRSNKS